MSLTDGEKLILTMLCEIHAHLRIKDGIDPGFVMESIYKGNTWGLKWMYPGIFDPSETPDAVVNEVCEIMTMWQVLEDSYAKLSVEDKTRVATEAAPFGTHVEFQGFDGNEETMHMGVARYLVDQLDRFTMFKGRDLNAHMPSVDAYRRMLKPFDQCRGSNSFGDSLSASQVIEILKARKN